MSHFAASSLSITERLGPRLRQLRKDRNYTQLQLAVTAGIDRSFISDVENAKKGISVEMVYVLALTLKLSLPELFSNL